MTSIQATDMASIDERNAFANQFRKSKNQLKRIKAPTDFTIKIGPYQWEVHSKVLSQASGFFEKICNGVFKESVERSATLHDDEPIMVGRMIQFMYCGDYSFPVNQVCVKSIPSLEAIMKGGGPGIPPNSLRATRNHIQPPMYVLGDKYDMKKLIEHSSMGLKTYIEQIPVDFAGVVDIIGIDTLLRDTNLCRLLFSAMAAKNLDIREPLMKYRDAILSDTRASNIIIDCMVHAAEAKVNDRLGQDQKRVNELVELMRSIDRIFPQLRMLEPTPSLFPALSPTEPAENRSFEQLFALLQSRIHPIAGRGNLIF